jgi:hypothetical protein
MLYIMCMDGTVRYEWYGMNGTVRMVWYRWYDTVLVIWPKMCHAVQDIGLSRHEVPVGQDHDSKHKG